MMASYVDPDDPNKKQDVTSSVAYRLVSFCWVPRQRPKHRGANLGELVGRAQDLKCMEPRGDFRAVR